MTDPTRPHPPTTPVPDGIAPPALPATEGAGTAPNSAATPATAAPAPGFDSQGRVRASKVSGVWVGLIGTALFLILLVVFVAQNSRRVSLHFFGWHGQFSLALTILLSAVIGVLLVAIPGTVRIVQLRSALRKNGPRAG
jgi:uncharacterized integral membrane protein